MKYLLLLILPLLSPKVDYIKVTVDWSSCPGAVADMTFIGETTGATYEFYMGQDIQTKYMVDDTYYITFSINSPLCTVTTEYSTGVVTHYDPGHAGQKLMSTYYFKDVCP